MNRISIKDYQISTQDNCEQTFTLLPDTVEKYGKKKTAGVPKTITIHIPETEEAQLRTDIRFAANVAEAVGKMLGV